MKSVVAVILFSISFCLFPQKNGKVLIVDYNFFIKYEGGHAYESSLVISKDARLFKWGNNKKVFKEEESDNYDFAFTMIDGDSIGSYNYYSVLDNKLITRFKWINDEEYFIEEEEPLIDWKISNETKTIGKISCQKATGRFRGRDYTAWFTAEFPINAGPWKLSGLPGLILEAIDSTGKVHFIFDRIYYGDSTQFPDYELESKKKITIEEFAKMQNSLGRDFTKKIMAKMPRGASIEITNSESLEIFDKKE